MRKTNTKRHALFTSVISLLLCVSMLMGTTFAWFTDSVKTGINTIAAGVLDVELYHSNAAVQEQRVDSATKLFMDLQGKPILWEPGVVSYENLRVVNAGELALAYQLAINTANENFIVDPSGAQYGLSQILKVGVVPGGITATDRAGVVASVAETDWTTLSSFLRSGSLLPEGAGTSEETWGVVIYWQPGENDNLWNLNNGKTLSSGEVLQIDLGVRLLATQESYESDSFGSDFDTQAKAAVFPNFVGGSASATVVPNEQNQTAAAVTMSAGAVAATVPAGVQLAQGVTELKLDVSMMGASGANIALGENEDMRSLDVHIEGVAADNTTPITVTLSEVAPVGLNMGNYRLYHVEASGTKEMTLVAAEDDFTAHNQFKYDPATGDIVLYMATFSEIALAANTVNPWKGEFNYDWYDASKTDLTIANADQLAAFGAIVGGMDGQTQNSFSGKTVKLISDINLGDKESENNPNIIFYPIGYYNSEGTYEKTNTAITSGLRNFEGTFDGNGHTISNFYHNTWEMKGDHNWYAPENQYYRDGMGLFGKVYKGTVKNLAVSHFSSDGEIATTGCIAAYADGATFENIAIFDCNPRVYNIGNGGIVGCVGWYAREADLKTTFTNITVDNSNKISALWGSYDVACGGIVGQYYPTSGQTSANTPANGGISFDNCHISAQMDVYNDVCANYQYYAYRYTGMLIGSVRENVTIDGHTYPKMDGITANNCTVHFGTWNDYYYCEIIDNTTASYTHDYQMSRLTEIKAIDGTTITYLDGTTGTVPASGRANYVIVDYSKGHGTENATCYHIKDGAVWTHDMGGIQTGIDENGDGQDDLKEDKQHIYLEFNNLVTGYGWGVTSKGVGDLAGVTILDREVGNSVEKFAAKENVKVLEAGKSYTLDTLFAAVDSDVEIKDASVTVAVTDTDGEENGLITAEFVPKTTDWAKGTLTFTGTGTVQLTIQDYYFCEPTTMTVVIGPEEDIETADRFGYQFPNVETYLYRVGNLNEFSISNIFKLKDGVSAADIGNVSIEVKDSNGAVLEVYTPGSSWDSGKIDFADTFTGPVKVTISDDKYSKPLTLNLEVVKAKNITTAAGSNGTSVVLLSDVKVSANGTANYQNCTVYGNGFTFDVRGGMNQYNSKQGHGIIIAKHATLDHLRVVGDVYDKYGMYASDFVGNPMNDYTGAIDAEFCVIQNCYIANCATPIRSNGNTIIDTTLYGGTVANLLISGGTNTLTNVTTVNHNDGRGVIGMGIVITDGANADNTKLILNGYLKQHNFVYKTDISEIKIDEGKTVFNSMFDDQFAVYHIGTNPKAVNTGIISINEAIDLVESHFVDNANTGYTIINDASIEISGKTFGAAVASVSGSGTSVDNNHVDNGNVQGDYLPTFNFDLGDQLQAKDNDDDTRYLIGDQNGLQAMYPMGETALTLDLTKLATVTKYTNVSYPVSAKCVGPDGKEQTGTATLSEKGTYKLVFTVADNVHYDQNGNKIDKSVTRTYEVELALDLYEKSIADATMTINSSDLTGEYVNSGTNKKYKMCPLEAISSIKDDANKDGELETFEFKNNIQSAELTPASNNAFSSPTTITVTYTGGQVLTIVLGTPSGLNSPGASNGGKTFSVKTDTTNGIYLQSDGAIASGSAVTGTWPLTSWSFKGTSGKVITDNTKVIINFTKPSGGSSPCVTPDTLVTLADGTLKRIDEISYTDKLLVWNFFKGKYDVAPAAIIFDHGADDNTVIKLTFDDGTVVKVVNMHQFFDADLNRFVTITEDTVKDYIGHRFAQYNGNGTSFVKLADYDISYEYVEAWGVMTAGHYNIITAGMISADFDLKDVDLFNYFQVGKNMKFDTKKMQEDIKKYGLYTYEDFAEHLTYEQFLAFNVRYFKIPVGKGLYTYEGILGLIEQYLNN